MSFHQDRLIHWALGSLELKTKLVHLGLYCGTWRASTTGMASSGFHLVLNGDCWLHLPEEGVVRQLKPGDAVIYLRDVVRYLSPFADPLLATQAPRTSMEMLDLTCSR